MMIPRTMFRCSTRALRAKPLNAVKRRRFSTASPQLAPSPAMKIPAPVGPALSEFTEELDTIAPRFDIKGEQIRVLRTPAEFYETLKEKIRNAEKRIFLSTLYIGKSENELIETLRDALRSKPNLKLSVMTDGLRGTRETPGVCSASLLAPLVEEFGPERVEIRMYHTPNLTGMRKKIVPKRVNEGWGLQHMKLYGCDDEIIMSGANLSNDYFTNRQDRYHVFSDKTITDYFYNLHTAVTSLSFRVVPAPALAAQYTLIWPSTNSAPSPLISPSAFSKASTKHLAPIIKQQVEPISQQQGADTSVYPLSQLTQLLKPDTSTELPAITSILRRLASPGFETSRWTFTAGYFNPDPLLKQLLINSLSSGTVITASQQANGFFGASGPAGLLPGAYTLYSRRFLEAAAKVGRNPAIILREWRFGTVGEPRAWTYHAKGFWVTMPTTKEKTEATEVGPSICVIGSSNYTKRSYSMDLEANCLIVTNNESLKKRLGEEEKWLQEHTEVVAKEQLGTGERKIGVKTRVAMWIVKMVGGAL